MVNIVNRTNHSLHDIPSELREFLKNDTYSLLVKGLSGTGKTTFSLSILRSLKAKNNFSIFLPDLLQNKCSNTIRGYENSLKNK